MPASKARYKSYLLRFWQEHDQAPWRARLESINKDGEVKHFADAKPLLALLDDSATKRKDVDDSDKN